jgi:phage-related protein
VAILSNLLVRIGVDDDKVRAGVGRAVQQFDRLNSSIEKLGKPTALAALAGSAVHLGAALAPAVGILAAVPGAALGAAAAMTTFKLAIDGVGDALGTAVEGDTKKFTEALQEMPPAARSVVKELGGALFNLRDRVQQEFFAPMVAGTRGLAKQMRGPLSSAMGTIASAMGQFGAQLVAVAREGKSLSFLRSLARAVSAGIRGAASGIGPLVRGIRDFAAAGLDVFGRTGQALGRLMTQAGQWLSRMAKSGKATQWINNAVENLKQLGRIGRNITLIIGGIFASAGGAGDLLTGIEQITAKLAEWVNSAEGQQQLGAIFAMLKDIASALVVILPVVAGSLSTIAGIIQSLPAPAREAVAQFLAWSLIIGVVTSRFGPLIKTIGLVGKSAAKGFSKLATELRTPESRLRRFAGRVASSVGTAAGRFAKAAGTMGKAAATAAGRVATAGGRMVASMAKASARVVAMWVQMAAKVLLQAARMAVSWIIAMGPIGWVIAIIVAIVALIIANWDKVRAFLVSLWEQVKSATAAAWNWIKEKISQAINLIKTIFANFNPVGIISKHWNTIKSATAAAWNWIKQKISAVWNGIKSVISGAANRVKSIITGAWNRVKATNQQAWNAVRNFVANAWNRIGTAVSNGINRVVSLAKGIGRRIRGAVGNLGSLLYNAGRNVIQGLINGIKSMIGRISGVMGDIAGKIRSFLPFSPAKEGPLSGSGSPMLAGQKIATMVADGMARGTGAVAAAAGGLAGAAGLSSRAYTPGGVRAAGAGGGPTVRLDIRSGGSQLDDLLVEVLRRSIRDRGGNVQAVLGSA